MGYCGSQVVLCDNPIHFDTYSGCSHACKYCFAQRNGSISEITKNNTVKALENLITSKKHKDVNWCDWDLPVHIGGMSDPFQPIERKYGLTYECLKLLAETKYPCIISTKGKLVADPKYLEVLKECNVVLQISMACSQYDVMEKGCPTFEERLKIAEACAPYVKRLIVRVQPYLPQAFEAVNANIPRFAAAGAAGVTFEGMKFIKNGKGLVKIGADFCFTMETLRRDFEVFRDTCHASGIAFYCAENRLRTMGDSMNCCGTDGVEGFKGNCYNLCHIINGDKVEPTEQMKQAGTAQCFGTLDQTQSGHIAIGELSFADAMLREYDLKRNQYNKIFGICGK